FVSVTDEDSLGIWEYGVSRGKWSLKLPSNRPACLALSGDGRTLAVGCEDHTVHVFDARTGQRLHQLPGHPGPARGVALDPQGDRLASVALDSFVVWDLSSGRKTAEGMADHALLSVAFEPDGEHLLVSGEFGVLQLRRLKDGKLVRDLQAHKN